MLHDDIRGRTSTHDAITIAVVSAGSRKTVHLGLRIAACSEGASIIIIYLILKYYISYSNMKRQDFSPLVTQCLMSRFLSCHCDS